MNIGLMAVDRTTFSLAGMTDSSADREYWLSRSPEERLRFVEVLRRINYGTDPSAERLQRILEITRRA